MLHRIKRRGEGGACVCVGATRRALPTLAPLPPSAHAMAAPLLSEAEAEVYDRQLRVWGVEGQQR